MGGTCYRPAAAQRVIFAVVKRPNLAAEKVLFIDFEGTAGERFWRKLLYGEAYGLRGVREASKIEGLRIRIGGLGKKWGGFRSIFLRVHRPLQKLLHEVFPRDEFESGFYGDPFLPIAFSLHSVLQAGAGV